MLAGKVALITGAASGIGRATAELFSRNGAQVAVVDVNEAGGRETVERIQAAGGDAIFVRCNVGRMDEVAAMVEQVVQHFGKLNIVHSNAAKYDEKNAVELTEAEWDRTLDVCLKAAWMIAHHSIPHMLAAGGGAFVITGSVHAIRGYARYTPYQAAKGGLLSLTRAMAADFAPTIRVNCILPGAIVTGLWSHVTPEEHDEIAQMCPLKRNAAPEEVAQVALFLASDMSSYITGESIVVDGGLSSIIQLT